MARGNTGPQDPNDLRIKVELALVKDWDNVKARKSIRVQFSSAIWMDKTALADQLERVAMQIQQELRKLRP